MKSICYVNWDSFVAWVLTIIRTYWTVHFKFICHQMNKFYLKKKKLAAVRLLLVALYTFCTQNDKSHRFPSRKSLLPSCGEYISQPLATKPMYEGCDLTNILAFLRQPAFADWTQWKNKDPTILAWPRPHLTPLFPPTTHTLLHLFPQRCWPPPW